MLRIAVLLLMGAFIAYFGDRIGTKIGKKRLSFFGLRPKNTAVIMTIITGMIITATTLGLSSIFVPNVRLALTEDIALMKYNNIQMQKDYSKALAEDRELREKIINLEAEVGVLATRKQNFEEEQIKALAEVEALRQEKLKIDTNLTQNLIEAKLLREQLQDKESELSNTRGSISLKNAELDEAKTELDNLSTRLTMMREDALRALETIAELSEIIEQKETRRILIHHMEPLVDYPLGITKRPQKDEFKKTFTQFLDDIAEALKKIGIEPVFLNSLVMSGFSKEVEKRVFDLFDKIDLDKNKGIETARGVLIYPVSEHNIFFQEPLEDVRFIVIEDNLLIEKGVEIARFEVDTKIPAEELLKVIFERDEQIKKLMFARGVLGNPFKARTPKQLIQFARFIDALKEDQEIITLSIIADDDIYASGNFAFRYNVIGSL